LITLRALSFILLTIGGFASDYMHIPITFDIVEKDFYALLDKTYSPVLLSWSLIQTKLFSSLLSIKEPSSI